MPRKSVSKSTPKLTDVDRRKRFVEMAKEVGASEDPKDFEKALKRVVADTNGRSNTGSAGKRAKP